uniref:Uncharacterized protein n=1 Tax=Romanomermis culicivorax TaxID=13658 RepID=A0A915I362_ROMCU
MAAPNIISNPIVTMTATILPRILPTVGTTITATTAMMTAMIIKATCIPPQTPITAVAIDLLPF